MDGDGWVDLYVANDAWPNFLYRNNRDGTFTEDAFFSGTALAEDGNEQGSMGLAIGDYNHDSRLDIYVSNFSDEYNTLYSQEGPLSFADVSYAARIAQPSLPFVGWATEFFDYDNDGWVDLLVVNGHVYPQMENVNVGTTYTQRMLLFRNGRDGSFAELAAAAGDALMTRQVSRGLGFGDIDNDGDVDLVVENIDGAPTILRNDGGSQNNWITVRTIGSKRNLQGLGARGRVTAGDLVQVDEVRGGGSYISQNAVRLHFGLETKDHVDSIEVRWSSGHVGKIEDIAVNQFVVIQEGKGIVEKNRRTPSEFARWHKLPRHKDATKFALTDREGHKRLRTLVRAGPFRQGRCLAGPS